MAISKYLKSLLFLSFLSPAPSLFAQSITKAAKSRRNNGKERGIQV